MAKTLDTLSQTYAGTIYYPCLLSALGKGLDEGTPIICRPRSVCVVRLAELRQGTLRLESTPDEGTTVWTWLPLAD